MEIISERKGNELRFFRKFNILFKEVKLRIKDKEIYSFNISKKIIPEITGITSIGYLFEKAKYHKTNKSSDFGKRVLFKINEFDFNGNKISNPNINRDIYIGQVYLEAIVSDLDNNEMFSITLRFNSSTILEPTKEFLEKLFSFAFSGIYSTARDEEAVFNFIEANRVVNYRCSECNNEFKNLNELYSHIIETKHYDLILDEFPHDEEILRVKQIICK